MNAIKKGWAANALGAVLLLAGFNLDPATVQQLSDYLSVLGVVVSPTKFTAGLGLIGLLINQFLIYRAKKELPAAETPSNDQSGFARPSLLAALSVSLLLVLATLSGVASAAPENEVPLTWTPPTARESGVALPASEIGGYQIFLDGVAFAQPAGNASSYTYVIPTDVCITPANKWYAVAKDTAGNVSKPSTTVSSVGIRCGPKSPPMAPGNVAVGF